MMNTGVGSLVLLGLILIVLGISSKFMGFSLLEPWLMQTSSYFVSANCCFLVAIIIDKYGTKTGQGK